MDDFFSTEATIANIGIINSNNEIVFTIPSYMVKEVCYER